MEIINPKVEMNEINGEVSFTLEYESLDSQTGDITKYKIPRIIIDGNLRINSDDRGYGEYEYINPFVYKPLLSRDEKTIEFVLGRDADGMCVDSEVIKQPRKLSVEEIEKKLGYPVEIIK